MSRRAGVIGAVVAAALLFLVAALLATEAVAKHVAREFVRDRVVAVLGVPDDADVTVDLGSGSILLQALAGRVDVADVTAREVSFGELTGAVRLHAEGVPLDAQAPVDTLRIDVAIGADDLAALAEGAGAAPSFVIADGEVRVSTDVTLFGISIPVGLAFSPSAADGDLVLSPTRVSIGGETIEPGSSDDDFFGQLVAGLLQPQTLCIAASVPAALVLTDATIDDAEVLLSFRGDGAVLGAREMSTPGTCASG